MISILLAVAMVVLLAISALCSGSETGFFSVNRGRVTHLARAGSVRAKILENALADMGRTLTGILVGNNLVGVAFSSASAALAARVFPDSASGQVAWSMAAAVVVLCFGEFLPKLFCSTRPLRRMLALAPAYRTLMWVLQPLTLLAYKVTQLFDSAPATREKVTANDLLRILSDRKDGVKLTDFESALIARILVLRVKGQPVTPDALLSALDETDI